MTSSSASPGWDRICSGYLWFCNLASPRRERKNLFRKWFVLSRKETKASPLFYLDWYSKPKDLEPALRVLLNDERSGCTELTVCGQGPRLSSYSLDSPPNQSGNCIEYHFFLIFPKPIIECGDFGGASSIFRSIWGRRASFAMTPIDLFPLGVLLASDNIASGGEWIRAFNLVSAESSFNAAPKRALSGNPKPFVTFIRHREKRRRKISRFIRRVWYRLLGSANDGGQDAILADSESESDRGSNSV